MAPAQEFRNAGVVRDFDRDVDFSLVLGGPLYQLYLRTKLVKSPLDLVHRRILVLCLICWLPLLLLSLSARNAFDGLPVPFLRDVGVQLRFLVALPLLVGAELVVHGRIRSIVLQFVERGIIAREDRARFNDLVASAMRLRNSVLMELLILLFACVSAWLWTEYLTMGVDTWYGVKVGGATHLTPAGYWYALVSLPILRFLIVRWYFRLFVWYWFLWHVRRLPLHLNLFHPDRAGGLGFLSGSVLAFAPVLAAQTILLAGGIGDHIAHAGATLPSFKMEILAAVAVLMSLVLTPLTFFVTQLESAGRKARREYGILASQYVDSFHRKWIDGHGTRGEPLLGTSDIQSLADLGNAYNVISDMHLVPCNKNTVIRLAVIVTAPLLPLTLTMVRLDEMIDRLVKLLL
jgi:hypothetical protein